MTFFEEPIDARFRVRFSFGDGSHSALSHGYSIKFILLDENNLLLYRNILESSYSSVKRSVKEKSPGGEKTIWKKSPSTKPLWSESTLQLLSRNFVDESCRLIGEEYRPILKKSVRRLLVRMNEAFPQPRKAARPARTRLDERV
jgi:hypothetical protein